MSIGVGMAVINSVIIEHHFDVINGGVYLVGCRCIGRKGGVGELVWLVVASSRVYTNIMCDVVMGVWIPAGFVRFGYTA